MLILFLLISALGLLTSVGMFFYWEVWPKGCPERRIVWRNRSVMILALGAASSAAGLIWMSHFH